MKISIITVSYNSEATLSRTFESILAQSHQDIDYVVIDGASTDHTIDIIRQYEPRFEGRMRWVSEPDKGLYDAMNKGVAMAIGDVIGILNSDDFFTTNDVLARMAAAFDDTCDAVYGDVHFVKETDLSRKVRYYSGKLFRPWMVRFGYIPPHPSLYVRRSIYQKYGPYDSSFRISADVEFIARISYVNNIAMKYIPMDFVTMLVGGESTKSLRNRWIGTKEDLVACRKLGIHSNLIFVHFKYFLKLLDYFMI